MTSSDPLHWSLNISCVKICPNSDSIIFIRSMKKECCSWWGLVTCYLTGCHHEYWGREEMTFWIISPGECLEQCEPIQDCVQILVSTHVLPSDASPTKQHFTFIIIYTVSNISTMEDEATFQDFLSKWPFLQGYYYYVRLKDKSISRLCSYLARLQG